MTVRSDPHKERGSEPKNGRGDLKLTQSPKRDCKGCPSSREKTGEVNNVTSGNQDSGQ